MNRQRQGNEERTDVQYSHDCVYCREGLEHHNRAHWHCIKKTQKAGAQLSQRRRETRQVSL